MCLRLWVLLLRHLLLAIRLLAMMVYLEQLRGRLPGANGKALLAGGFAQVQLRSARLAWWPMKGGRTALRRNA